MRSEHQVIGMLNESETEIECYVHERHKIGECPWCDFIRVDAITDEFLRRMDSVDPPVSRLNMWSLGSSLRDSPMNRKIMQSRWHRFQAGMIRRPDWAPLFRVIEVGRRGYLHFHVITERYTRHSTVLRMWRIQTWESSNVHVSGYKGVQDPRRLTRYLLKYLSKSSSTYWWLGRFHGLGSTKRGRLSSAPCRVYGGVTCYTMSSQAYVERRDPQDRL